MSSSDRVQTVDHEWSSRVATLDSDYWHGIIDSFEDASIFQTTPFCTESGRSQGCEHLIVSNGSEVVAAAQIRVMSTRLPGASVAYVISGPLFHRRGRTLDWNNLGQALKALRNEYVARRRISLRINPLYTQELESRCVPLFQAEGYSYSKPRNVRRTIIINVDSPLDELRKGLEQKWRNQLNRAEKNGLQIVEGPGDSMFDLFLQMYRQMLARKRLGEPGDIRTFRAMQAVLPERLKMRVFVVLDNGIPSAGAICSAIGRRGVYLFGATAEMGMKNKASYLAQWRAIQWIKEMRCTEYDLHGVNAKVNPGVYNFKTGLCGKNGKELELMGHFDVHSNTVGRTMLSAADFANRTYKSLKNIYGKYRGFQG